MLMPQPITPEQLTKRVVDRGEERVARRKRKRKLDPSRVVGQLAGGLCADL